MSGTERIMKGIPNSGKGHAHRIKAWVSVIRDYLKCETEMKVFLDKKYNQIAMMSWRMRGAVIKMLLNSSVNVGGGDRLSSQWMTTVESRRLQRRVK